MDTFFISQSVFITQSAPHAKKALVYVSLVRVKCHAMSTTRAGSNTSGAPPWLKRRSATTPPAPPSFGRGTPFSRSQTFQPGQKNMLLGPTRGMAKWGPALGTGPGREGTRDSTGFFSLAFLALPFFSAMGPLAGLRHHGPLQ